jgi:predicted ATPase/class 3 adenylate cyclase
VAGRTHLPSGLVTFMFTDIEGSTRLARTFGTNYRRILIEHRLVLRRALSEQDGTELFTEGDSFFVAFADAGAAIAASLAAQRALAGHDWPSPQAAPRVRMGLHTGRAKPIAGEYASAEVHRAARIAAAAHGGQVLCSAATAQHAETLPNDASLIDLGLHRLRGFDGRERLFQLVAPGLQRRFPRPRTPMLAAHNLPAPVTSFVGRRAERDELTALVNGHRLVTVVGAGGSGKTRLAVEVASRLVEAHPDGTWFVDAAAARSPEELTADAALLLGVRPEPGRPLIDTVADAAAGRRMLLVLDTCDAQPAAAADLAMRLLAAGGGVRVLATGRQPLATPGELVWRVPPLRIEPGPDGTSSEALTLLLDRAAAALGGRGATPGDMVELRRVVSRLDGLPLAIELAAARLRLLSPRQLADRLDDIIGTLDAGNGGPEERPRHATLAGNVTWSYRGLAADPARLLRRMAVFASPVDLEALEALLDGDPLDALAVLVDRSLVEVEPRPAGPRYRMLAPVRAYAGRRLVEAGEERTARERHVNWVRRALHRVQVDADGQPITLSLYALDAIADEARGALRWSAADGDARDGFALAGGLSPWWRERGLAREGRHWLSRLYERVARTGQRIPPAELAEAYHAHAGHAGADGAAAEEMGFVERAETAAQRASDPGLLARVRSGRGVALIRAGRWGEAERVFRDVVAWAERHGVGSAVFPAVVRLAGLLWRRGVLDEAADLLGAARPIEATGPEQRGRRSVDMLLGMVALRRGDLVAAHDHLIVALRSRIRYGYHGPARDTVSAMAVRCAIGGDPLTASRLFGAAEAAGGGLRRIGLYGEYWAAQQATVRAALGDAAFDTAYAAGGRLGLDDAVAEALAVEHPDLLAGSARFSGSGSRTP